MARVDLPIIHIKWEHYLCRNCDLAFKQRAHNLLHMCPRCQNPETPQLLDVTVESYPREPAPPEQVSSEETPYESAYYRALDLVTAIRASRDAKYRGLWRLSPWTDHAQMVEHKLARIKNANPNIDCSDDMIDLVNYGLFMLANYPGHLL